MKNNQKGFSALHILLLCVVIGVLGFAGWKVWQSRSKQSTTTTQSDSEQNSQTQTKTKNLKEYRNSEYGFSFQYPEDWELKENLAVAREGTDKKEGTLTLMSPSGTTVEFAPNLGGKGGGCGDPNPADTPHNTQTCSTLELLDKIKLDQSKIVSGHPLYLYKFRYTGPKKSTSEYSAALSNQSEIDDWSVNSPKIDAYLPLGIINAGSVEYVNTQITGVDNSSASVFETDAFKQAYDILRSFKLF